MSNISEKNNKLRKYINQFINMAQYTDNTSNIIYNNVSGGTKVSKLTNGSTDFELEDIVPVVNAVEIDWNGAVVGENKTLNTTGEVLSRYKVAI